MKMNLSCAKLSSKIWENRNRLHGNCLNIRYSTNCLQESVTFEINYIRNDVRGCIHNICNWVADDYVEKNIGENL